MAFLRFGKHRVEIADGPVEGTSIALLGGFMSDIPNFDPQSIAQAVLDVVTKQAVADIQADAKKRALKDAARLLGN